MGSWESALDYDRSMVWQVVYVSVHLKVGLHRVFGVLREVERKKMKCVSCLKQ